MKEMQNRPHKIEISARTILFTIVVLLALQLIWIVRELIFSFIVAFIIMSAFNPFVTRLERWYIPRALSALCLFIILLTGLGYLFAVLIPPVVQETTVLVRNLPSYLQKMEFYKSLNLDQNFFTKYVPDLTNNAFDILRNTFSNVISVISTLFFSFYFLIEKDVIKKLLSKFFDKKDTDAIAGIFERAEMRMRDWLWGELVLMIAIGVATYIGLTLLGVRYVVPLALFAGLLEVVPVLGPTISAVPAFLITASQSLFSGVTVIALYFVIQQLENQILVPVIMRRALGLSPIVTLAALIVGGKLGGILGIFLAIPVSLCIETIVTESLKLRRA